ncbi:MAG: VIT and VWA domain-containing protein [Bacteroidales bacterium]
MKPLRYIYLLGLLIFYAQSFAGGIIIIEPKGGNPNTRIPYVLEVRSLKVETSIKDQYAFTKIEEIFYNPTNSNLEGYFLFPVPKGCVIKDFSMDINGKKMQAELLDAEKALKIYEDIVRKLRDPALLEYAEQAMFKLRIFPIEPMKEKRIEISYSEILERDNNTEEYIFPLNTKKYSAAPLKNLSFKIDVESSQELKTIYSPTHELEIKRKDDKHATIGFEASVLEPNQDLRLFLGFDNSKIGISLLSYKINGEDGFFLLNINPGFSGNNDKIVSKDITFVLDVSGSMAGDKMEQARKALLFCVNNLNTGDKFEIIKFSTEAEALFGKRVDANDANRAKANDFIKNLKPIGGTNIDEALQLACKEKKSADRPNMIVFITDGKPTIGETNEDGLLKKISSNNAESTRIFTFGIGDDLNTHLLDKITEQTNAYRTYISEKEDIEVKISNFYTKVSSPILTEIELKFNYNGKVRQVFPHKIPDIFKGSSLTVLGRFEGSGTVNLSLEGKVNGKTEKHNFEGKFEDKTENDFIAPLWAARNVGYLLDQIRLHGESKELIDEIVNLSKKYGIITPYTSYLILEDEQINLANNNLRDDQVIFNHRFAPAQDEEFRSRGKEEYSNLNKKSGQSGVVSSSEVQNLGFSDKLDDNKQGASRMLYTDKTGKTRNLSSQVKNIQGRAVYQQNEEWIDLYVQNSKDQKVNRIKFASTEYFNLLNQYPETAQFLSLGQNVKFVYKKNQYEIYE